MWNRYLQIVIYLKEFLFSFVKYIKAVSSVNYKEQDLIQCLNQKLPQTVICIRLFFSEDSKPALPSHPYIMRYRIEKKCSVQLF